MANTTSAKKATRKIARRTIVNKSRRTQMRGAVRTVEEAIKSGDRNAALEAMKRAEPELMQAAQRNIIHRNNASRKVSRLTHAIAKLAKLTDRNRYSSKARLRRAFVFSVVPERVGTTPKIHFTTTCILLHFRRTLKRMSWIDCDNSIVPLLNADLPVTFLAPVVL